MQPINLQQALDYLYLAAGKAPLTREEHEYVKLYAQQLKKFVDETLAEATDKKPKK